MLREIKPPTGGFLLPVISTQRYRCVVIIRKLGKTHQNILMFVKGDPVEAAKFCGEVDVSDALAKFGEDV
ncbi:hypothetical protein DQR71_21765 [Salmonella enterica subsp. enterica serovar Kingston]|nr:hypothetical protein [Salmonella enterica subsp. enterica serovar Kingston]